MKKQSDKFNAWKNNAVFYGNGLFNKSMPLKEWEGTLF